MDGGGGITAGGRLAVGGGGSSSAGGGLGSSVEGGMGGLDSIFLRAVGDGFFFVATRGGGISSIVCACVGGVGVCVSCVVWVV